ncbi:hypothetical protein F5B21DRAFT_526516 [Xylaria acuta]|nr:hypothetical protein F5B21DRAFT_526516 [Xylaria acuta]
MATRKISKSFNTATDTLGYLLMNITTLSYYRFFNQNTLLPIRLVEKWIRMGRSREEVHRILTNWQGRKLFELQFVQVAGTLLSGATIGCFSWNVQDEEHWDEKLGPASWYCCLVLSLFATLTSLTEAFIFSSMKSSLRPVSLQSRLSMIRHTDNYPTEVGSFASTNDSEKGKSAEPPPVRCHIRWNMVFTWQAPIMLLSYGVIAFLVGISVYIITPLYTNDKSLGGKPAAVLYLATLVASGAVVPALTSRNLVIASDSSNLARPRVTTGFAVGGSAMAHGIDKPFYLEDAKFSISAQTGVRKQVANGGGAGESRVKDAVDAKLRDLHGSGAALIRYQFLGGHRNCYLGAQGVAVPDRGI